MLVPNAYGKAFVLSILVLFECRATEKLVCLTREMNFGWQAKV